MALSTSPFPFCHEPHPKKRATHKIPRDTTSRTSFVAREKLLVPRYSHNANCGPQNTNTWPDTPADNLDASACCSVHDEGGSAHRNHNDDRIDRKAKGAGTTAKRQPPPIVSPPPVPNQSAACDHEGEFVALYPIPTTTSTTSSTWHDFVSDLVHACMRACGGTKPQHRS